MFNRKLFQCWQKSYFISYFYHFERIRKMSSKSFSNAAIRVISLVQIVISLPIKLTNTEDISKLKLEKNPKYFENTTTVLTRLLIVTFALLLNFFSVGRLAWIILFTKVEIDSTISQSHTRQIMSNLLVICLLTIGLSVFSTFHVFYKEISYLATQRFRLVQVPMKKNCKFSDNINSGDIYVYLLSSCFLAFPIFVTFGPLASKYDPLKVMYRILCPDNFEKIKWTTKLSFGIIYGIITVSFAGTVLLALLIIMLVLEGVEKLSRNLCKWPSNVTKQTFSKKLKVFRIIQVILTVGNDLAAYPVFVLVTVGIMLASCCGYATLKRYNSLPFAAYLACPVIVCLAISIAFLFLPIADIPFQNGKLFKTQWKHHMKTKTLHKLENCEVKSLPLIGYNIGPTKHVGRYTALQIADQIVDKTVFMALLS